MLLNHSAHDHAALIERWRALAGSLGATVEVLWESDGLPVPVVRTKIAGSGGLYASAGIHGDEAAGAWGLLDFVENNVNTISKIPATFIPCFNPWGFINNIRNDEQGNDLNRMFLHQHDPRVKAWGTLVDGLEPGLAMNFHEDFDSLGCYIYEHGKNDSPIGWEVLKAAEKYIPSDTRSEIEGRSAKDGLIWIQALPDHGDQLPESVALHHRGSKRTLTIETPSELGLETRIIAHRTIAETAFRIVGLGAR